MASSRLSFLGAVLEGFRTSWLVAALGLVFLFDLFVPDLVPFLDELALGVASLLFARWRGRRAVAEAEKPPTKNVTPPGVR